MGASNWRKCPKCEGIVKAIKAELSSRASDAYGKCSPEEFLKLRDLGTKPINMPELLREDYQLGVYSDGQFSVGYSCSCSRCGFSHDFTIEEKTDIGHGEDFRGQSLEDLMETLKHHTEYED